MQARSSLKKTSSEMPDLGRLRKRGILAYGEARTTEEPERTPTVREDSEVGRNEARGQKTRFHEEPP